MTQRERYEQLRLYKELCEAAGLDSDEMAEVIKLKQDLRRIAKTETRSRIMDDCGDAWTELIELPDWIRTKEEALEYAADEIYIPRRYRAYDCTGEVFTIWTKVGKLSGRWACWHQMGLDV